MPRLCLTPRQAMEWTDTSRMLRLIAMDLLREWPRSCMYVTSIWRNRAEDQDVGGSGIHTVGPPYRALDVRSRTLGVNHQREADRLAAMLNGKYVYDPRRPGLAVAVSFPHGTGPHIHLQDHPATSYRELRA